MTEALTCGGSSEFLPRLPEEGTLDLQQSTTHFDPDLPLVHTFSGKPQNCQSTTHFDPDLPLVHTFSGIKHFFRHKTLFQA